MSRMRAAVLLTGFVGITVALMPVQLVLNRTSRHLARHLPHRYHRAVARMLGFRVALAGDIPAHGPVLLISNHVSWIDIVAISAALPVSFIAKQEVGGWPFFGWLAKLQRSIFIDRERRHKTGRARDEIGRRLGQGDMLVLFPEGTSHDGVNVLPFKSSLLGVAEGREVPVIPVTIAYRSVNGLPMTRRQRPTFAWYGDMDLPRHLWNALKTGPIGIEITFHPALPRAATRKAQATSAEQTVRQRLSRSLHGRS